MVCSPVSLEEERKSAIRDGFMEMLRKEFGGGVLLPPEPQLTCALGAALFAKEGAGGTREHE